MPTWTRRSPRPRRTARPTGGRSPRRRSLERLEAEIAKAETDRGQWAVRAESLRARGLDNRDALGLVQAAEGRLAQLNRSREALLEGDAGRDEPEPEAE